MALVIKRGDNSTLIGRTVYAATTEGIKLGVVEQIDYPDLNAEDSFRTFFDAVVVTVRDETGQLVRGTPHLFFSSEEELLEAFL